MAETLKGRIVYNRKKHFMTFRDVKRLAEGTFINGLPVRRLKDRELNYLICLLFYVKFGIKFTLEPREMMAEFADLLISSTYRYGIKGLIINLRNAVRRYDRFRTMADDILKYLKVSRLHVSFDFYLRKLLIKRRFSNGSS